MTDSKARRTQVSLLLVVGMAVLLLVGVGLYSVDRSVSSLPGKDLSDFQPSAVPGHIASLKSPEAATRRKAAHTLFQIGDAAKEATPALIQAAADPDPGVRETAVKALGRTGQDSQEAISALIRAFQDNRAEVRIAAATSLAETWRISGKAQPGTRRP